MFNFGFAYIISTCNLVCAARVGHSWSEQFILKTTPSKSTSNIPSRDVRLKAG